MLVFDRLIQYQIVNINGRIAALELTSENNKTKIIKFFLLYVYEAHQQLNLSI